MADGGLVATDGRDGSPRIGVGRQKWLALRDWSAPVARTAFAAVVILSVRRFLDANSPWLGSFWRDLFRWLLDPSVAAAPRAPARPALGAVVIAVCLSIGWFASALALHRTSTERDRFLRAGFTIAFAIAALGFVGTMGVVLGQLHAAFLWVGLALLLAGFGVWWWRLEGRLIGKRARPASAGGRDRRVLACGVFCAIVVVLLATHAIMSPVLEWDALIYHAEAARLWFLTRPAPPLMFGPSVGIEISINYPPLFPATGAAFYTLLNRFDDVYLRLISPMALISLLLLVYGAVRRRLGAPTAVVAVLLVIGAPLVGMYAAWTTSYMLLTTLFFGVIVLADLASERGDRWTWIAAGAVAGLASLTHFFGMFAVPAALAVSLVRRQRPSHLGLFVTVAGAVVSPWLLRNLVLLHDPLYPLASPPFLGRGLVEPIWQATKDGLMGSALGYWGGAEGLGLWLKQALTLGFDRHLPPVGVGVGVVMGLTMWRRGPSVAILAIAAAIFAMLLWLPGWFWVRAILVLVPLAAGPAAAALISARDAGASTLGDARGGRLELVSRTATRLALVAAVGASTLTAITVATAGPNYPAWLTNQLPSSDLMEGVKAWGDAERQRWGVYHGDALLWEWINRRVPAGVGVATLEPRTYPLEHPLDLFFLDGVEAAPLLEATSADAAAQFLRREGIGYIVVPAWNLSAPPPIMQKIPLFGFVGTDRFPAIAAFPSGTSDIPSMVYSVGPASPVRAVGVYPGSGQPQPGSDGSAKIPVASVDPRIAVPLAAGASVLEFSYDRAGFGTFDMNLFDPSNDVWITFRTVARTGAAGWGTVRIPLRSWRGFAMLGIYVRGHPLPIRDVRVVPLRDA